MPLVEGNKFTSDAVHTITASTLVGSVLSFCGSLFACTCFLAFKSKRTFALQLVFLLSVNDVFSQLWVFTQGAIALASGDMLFALCRLQSYLASYFVLACTLWSACIAYTLYATVLLDKSARQVSRLLPYFIVFAQGVPLLSCIVSTAFGAYGKAGAWCWITSDTPLHEVLQFATMYIPCWICIAFNAVVYVRVRLRLRQSLRAQKHWLPPAAAPQRAAPAASTPAQAPGADGLAAPLLLGVASRQRSRSSSSTSLWGRFSESTARLTSAPDYESEDDSLGSDGEDPEASAVTSRAWSRPIALELPSYAGSFAASHDGDDDDDDDDGFDTGSVVSVVAPEPLVLEQAEEAIRKRRVRVKRLAGRLLAYPLILAFCWTWATIDRVYGLFSEKPEFWMSLTHGVGITIIGFLNSIAYGLTDGIRQEVAQSARRLCGGGKEP